MLISLVTMVGLAWEEGQWGGSWAAIKQVWASKWNERAVLSLRRAKLSHSALQMAVLCQEVVPAQYAFVAHTTNPTTGERLVKSVRHGRPCMIPGEEGRNLQVTRPFCCLAKVDHALSRTCHPQPTIAASILCGLSSTQHAVMVMACCNLQFCMLHEQRNED